MPPIVIYPAEVAARVVLDDHYVIYDVTTERGEVLLSVAVRDDAPWADRIVQQIIADNQ